MQGMFQKSTTPLVTPGYSFFLLPCYAVQLVPEFVQEDADAENIAVAALRLLHREGNAERVEMIRGYERLKALLGAPGAAKQAALHVLTSIGAM